MGSSGMNQHIWGEKVQITESSVYRCHNFPQESDSIVSIKAIVPRVNFILISRIFHMKLIVKLT